MITATLLAAAIVSMLLHEAAHGVAATALGDPIPGRWKRATWNPFAHVDPIMTLAVPLILGLVTGGRFVVGAAKPMPIGWNHLERMAQLIVILAGVWMNAGLGLLFLAYERPWFQAFAQLQFVLVIVNLLPIPPLDGWRLVQWTRRTLVPPPAMPWCVVVDPRVPPGTVVMTQNGRELGRIVNLSDRSE